MGLGNGNKKKGDKGSNFAYEYGVLTLLKKILAVTPVDTSLLAKDSTLISILNAITTSNQDVEILLVRDTGNNDQVVQQVTDYVSNPPTTTYVDVNGNAYTPVGPLEYLDPSAVINLVLSELQLLNAGGQLLTEATFVAEDFATETTLNAIKLKTDLLNFIATALEVNVTSAVLPSDAATETTLAAIKTATESVNTSFDVLLSTRASEATLAAQATDIGNLLIQITELNNKVNTLGQKASAASTPVVLSTEQEAILDNLTKQLRTHTYQNVSVAGTIPANTLRGSIMNVGDEDGLFQGVRIPAGVTIAWGAAGMRDKYSSMTYDPTAPGTGTTFLIEYTI